MERKGGERGMERERRYAKGEREGEEVKRGFAARRSAFSLFCCLQLLPPLLLPPLLLVLAHSLFSSACSTSPGPMQLPPPPLLLRPLLALAHSLVRSACSTSPGSPAAAPVTPAAEGLGTHAPAAAAAADAPFASPVTAAAGVGRLGRAAGVRGLNVLEMGPRATEVEAEAAEAEAPLLLQPYGM
jgi:hypothetical protein